MRPLILAALVCLLCVGAAAQDKIYKVRLPDGRILFTDRPPQGAQILSTPLQERSADAQSRLRERAAEVDRAFANVQAAERELEQARQALEQGRAPQTGEMIGTARGRVRQGPAYQERLAELEKSVTAAEQKLAKARDELNAAR
jgi:DNA repair ATPase RecN